MAFDEQGQADTRRAQDRRSASAPTDLLTEQVGFPAEDIIFDPNIFAIATGIEEHDNYAVDFIEATRWIKRDLPHAQVSGGVSQRLVLLPRQRRRCARRSTPCSSTTRSRPGMTMGIVNAGQLGVYEDIPPDLRERVEDVMLNRRPDATERLVEFAEHGARARREAARSRTSPGATRPVERAPRARAGEGHRRLRRRGHRGGARTSSARAARR
ncbi:MAG: dihydropteroate synthase [Comamonadaceae bacterium]|nr:dihydropteroate synthase [Comamonadaceae bacterium]